MNDKFDFSEPQLLIERLRNYNLTDTVPMHMPGHKRNSDMLGAGLPWELDITEIEPFDDLHHADGILLRSMERAAALFGSRRAFYLVNGSSCGLLAAICALGKAGGSVIVSRACHQSVFHGIELSGLMPHIIEPSYDGSFGIYGAVSPETVYRAASENPDAAALIITSPSYDGVISDIEGILKVLNPFGIPLIVDEAHGAHLGLHEYFPKSAVQLGADVVVQSLHKTLPALTQSAMLHLNSDLVSETEILRQLRIFETSSPSYVLMASMDYCTAAILEHGDAWFSAFAARLQNFYAEARRFKRLRVFGACGENAAAFARDASKIVVSSSGRNGAELSRELLSRGVQCEMSGRNHAVLMSSICSSDEHFARLLSALWEIDEALPDEMASGQAIAPPPAPVQALPPRKAMEGEGEMERIGACAGRISAEYVWAYPPGVPILIPGQIVDDEILRFIQSSGDAETYYRSSYGGLPQKLRVLKFSQSD